MASQVEIYNMALGHLGVGKSVASATEASAEARACQTWYETARDAVLRDHPWPFAKKTVTLSLVEEDPTDLWAYSYRVPSDCVYFRRIVSGENFDTNTTKVDFEVVGDDAGELVYTNEEDASAEYTARVTATSRFRPDFVLALAARLAMYIAPRITGSANSQLGQRAAALYAAEIQTAQANAQNESPTQFPPEADLVRIRS